MFSLQLIAMQLMLKVVSSTYLYILVFGAIKWAKHNIKEVIPRPSSILIAKLADWKDCIETANYTIIFTTA